MEIPSNLFLFENNPQKNLGILASLSPAETSGTKCITENVYRKLPKTNLSPSTIREIAVTGTLFTIIGGPVLVTAKKAYECTVIFFLHARECIQLATDGQTEEALAFMHNFIKTVTEPFNALTFFCYASLVTLTGIGVYAGARWYLQDSAQGERFELLDKEYSGVAKHMLEQYRVAQKKGKQDLIEMAEQLERKKDLIRFQLMETGRLSEPQAHLLTAKIGAAASQILRSEQKVQRAAEMQPMKKPPIATSPSPQPAAAAG